MEWQAVVLGLQILLLAVGWLLFQQARGELSARAAEVPVLSEIKALQKSVKQLLLEIEEASDTVSERLEKRCDEARELLRRLESQLSEADERQAELEEQLSAVRMRASIQSSERDIVLYAPPPAAQVSGSKADAGPRHETRAVVQKGAGAGDSRRRAVYELADSGISSIQIARETGLSEGEVETLLSLRLQLR